MLKLPKEELDRLGIQIQQDFQMAKGRHTSRMSRFVDYYRRWRNRVLPPKSGEEDRANFQVPMTQWTVFAELARTMQSLLGDDAQIVAQPTGAADQRNVHKIGCFATAAFLRLMPKAITKYAIFIFRAILFGRAHAYRPWERLCNEDGECYYEGPAFDPLWPDDLIVPAEDVDSIQKFSFVIRRFRVTPDDLLEGETDGKYFGITDDFEKIVSFARDGSQRSKPLGGTDEIKEEKDEAEGVTYEGGQLGTEVMEAWEWYGYTRLPNAKNAGDDALTGRELRRTQLVVTYIPLLNKVVGVDLLKDRYPKMRNRRPFSEMSFTKDGSYWAMGFGEMLCSIEDEVSANRNLFTESMQFSAAPHIFFEPAAGFNPQTFRYIPGGATPVTSANGVQVVTVKGDLQGPLLNEQAMASYAERATGVSDQTMGRSIERPNAPRTASGQIALIEQGNIRVFLNVMFCREDFKEIFRDLWEMYSEFAPPSVFFRVTEEDADGLFEVKGGGATMTEEEFGGRYDFDIEFATSTWSREADKQRDLTLYQLDLQNPLIMQNPRALWMITRRLHSAMGDDNFADVVPEPPDLGMPKNPKEEWTLMLQGEDVEVNPMDNDDLHLHDHYRRAMEAKQDRKGDMDALNRMAKHIVDHQNQKRSKMLMQALTQQLTQSLHQNSQDPSGGGLHMGGGVPVSIQQLQQHLAGLTGEQPGQPGQPGGPVQDGDRDGQ